MAVAVRLFLVPAYKNLSWDYPGASVTGEMPFVYDTLLTSVLTAIQKNITV